MVSGEILRIDAHGKIRRSHFDDSNIYPGFSQDWHYWANYDPARQSYTEESDYLEDLKSVAVFYGIYPEDIDAMIEDGMDLLEIEELLYCR